MITHYKNETVIAPKLRFKEFRDELEATRFGKVVESNLYGPRFNANDYSNDGNVKTIRGTDLGRDGEIKYSQVPLARLDENTISNHKLEDGDIVMITTAECGATGVFRKQDIDYLSSAYGVRIRLNHFGFPDYFKYFFQTHLAKKEINSFIRKATVANLPGSDILRIKLYLPPFPEQQKIASFLSAVDEKIQQLTRKKELLEKYKKGVMQQLFSGKLRFRDENGRPYQKWEEKKLGNVAEIVGGGTPETSVQKYWDGPIQWFTPTEINQRFVTSSKRTITEEGLKNSSAKLLPAGTLLFTSRATIAEISFAKMECTTNQGFQSLIVNKENSSGYIYYWIRQNTKEFLKKSQGSTFPEISKNEIIKIKVKIPCLEEQQKIASFLSALDSKIESVVEEITHTQTFKKGLLQQMFV